MAGKQQDVYNIKCCAVKRMVELCASTGKASQDMLIHEQNKPQNYLGNMTPYNDGICVHMYIYLIYKHVYE